jgi:hypothetical protein
MGNTSEKAIKNIVFILYIIAMLAMGTVAVVALTPAPFGWEIEPLVKLVAVSVGLNIILASFLISVLLKNKLGKTAIAENIEKEKRKVQFFDYFDDDDFFPILSVILAIGVFGLFIASDLQKKKEAIVNFENSAPVFCERGNIKKTISKKDGWTFNVLSKTFTKEDSFFELNECARVVESN